MIDHIGIIVSDLSRSATFYSAALKPLSYVEKANYGVVIGFGSTAPSPTSQSHAIDFWVSPTKTPGAPITPVHLAFVANDQATVDAFYEAAIAAGGKDNGRPGLRPQYHAGYYGAFVLDLDGHNVEVVFHGASA
ncbi:hypothetical protein HDV00_011366 [Rhizophlyctis rosea]|nr:hypothetical protein HDV00_011366 [Rhizophlyctis rosea]